MWPFSRRTAPPVPCNRWRNLEYHRCVWPRGHRPPCRFEMIGRPLTIHRPDVRGTSEKGS